MFSPRLLSYDRKCLTGAYSLLHQILCFSIVVTYNITFVDLSIFQYIDIKFVCVFHRLLIDGFRIDNKCIFHREGNRIDVNICLFKVILLFIGF